MATALAPMTTPTRQPFGVVTDNQLRQLQSMKNRQNALAPSSAPSLKRRAPSPDLSDSENVDPNVLEGVTSKRKRWSFDSDVSYSKPSKYSLDLISKPQTTATPRLSTLNTSTTPVSAPPAAGRSPTRSNRHGVLPPKRKLVAPSFGIKAPAVSIYAALNGTLAGKKRGSKAARTLASNSSSSSNNSNNKVNATITTIKPKSWFFDIFEEPAEVQNDRMNEWTLSQGASFLDVSDDECKSKKEQTEQDKDNKENIDPDLAQSPSVPVTRSMAAAKAAAEELRQDMKMMDDRSPLGDLNPVDYYAPGLDATSVILVHDEAVAEQTVHSAAKKSPEPSPAGDNSALATSEEEDIGALIAAASAPLTWEANQLPPLEGGEGADIEIWESQSAKDENEKQREGSVDNVFAPLQEV